MAVQVGEFPGIASKRKQIPRSIPNPLDKSTIVSIYPGRIDDVKPTLFPGRFVIEAGSFEKPSITIIGPSSSFRQMPNDEPLLEIPYASMQIADSVIRDYCNGMLGCDMEDRRPGLFFIPGEFTLNDIKTKYAEELVKTQAKQKNWFFELVKLADSLWARSNNNPMVIWDVMRVAARELGLNSKAWLQGQEVTEMIKCFACGGLRNPAYPICPSCRVIDKSHPASKDLVFAQQTPTVTTPIVGVIQK